MAKQKQPDMQEKLLHLVLGGLANEKGGVHIETALTLLGALTGFATQMAVRETLIVSGKAAEGDVFTVVKAEDGSLYYLGPVLLHPLIRMDDGHTSLFKLCASVATHLGANRFPDTRTLVEHVTSTFGTPAFGVPRLPQQHVPQHPPLPMLRDAWDTIETYLRTIDGGDPLNWPYLLTAAAGNLAAKSKGVLDAHMIVPLVLESAVPMSYVDPALVRGQSNHGGEKTVDFTRATTQRAAHKTAQ